MAKLINLARVATATTGTGTIALGSAIGGFLTFAQGGANDGDIISYGITDGTASEVGTGTYTASGTTLTRTVINSTNGNAAISLSGSAQVFGTALALDFGCVVKIIKFTASGTYTPSAGMRYVLAELIAPGGGGGGVTGSTSQFYAGGGGAAGQYVRSRLTSVQIGASQTITIGSVGTGGSGSVNGTAGGDVTLGSLMTAKGGAGGFYGAAAQVAGGGQGSVTGGIGDFVQSGGSGGYGAYNAAGSQPALPAGYGGVAAFGSGATPPSGYAAGTSAAGLTSTGFGGGGSGAAASSTTSGATGGNGAPGIAIITEYCAY